MHIANIKFKITDLSDDVTEFIEYLVHNLHHQGRIIHLRNNQYEINNSIVVQCRIPEKNSLSVISENKWANKLEGSGVKIDVEIMGECSDQQDICNCDKIEATILSGSSNIPLYCAN